MHPVIQIWTFLCIYTYVCSSSRHMGAEQLHERGVFCIKALFAAYLWPLVHNNFKHQQINKFMQFFLFLFPFLLSLCLLVGWLVGWYVKKSLTKLQNFNNILKILTFMVLSVKTLLSVPGIQQWSRSGSNVDTESCAVHACS